MSLYDEQGGESAWVIRGLEQERDALRGEVVALRGALEMFLGRLNAYEVTRIVTVDGPDDPKGREGALAYRASFTNGEMEDARQSLSSSPISAKLVAVVAAAVVTVQRWQECEDYKNTDYILAWDSLEDAVDALREAQEGKNG